MKNERPEITQYLLASQSPTKYLADMLRYLKFQNPRFSIAASAKKLRKLSPTLVSLMSKGQRRLTLDRVEAVACLLLLSHQEKTTLREWVAKLEFGETPSSSAPDKNTSKLNLRRKKATAGQLLQDWIHPYVKEAFHLPEVQKRPELLHILLSKIASPSRIDKSLKYLISHGFLRRCLDGSLVPEVKLHTIDQEPPSKKIRAFHKAALMQARHGLDTFKADERFANSLILTLTPKGYSDLITMIAKFSDELNQYAESIEFGERLYQVTLNLTPVGGSIK